MRILIVTPTYNEKENLAPFLDGVFQVLEDAHVLVVDDNSPDGTGALADRIAEADPRVKVMHRPGKMGLGSAYLDAFELGVEGVGAAGVPKANASLAGEGSFDVGAADVDGEESVLGNDLTGGSAE